MSGKFDLFFDNLYLENYKSLLNFAYRLTNEKNFSEEIVQDAFVEAYKKIELLYHHENPVGWLYLTVRNISKAYLRELAALKRRISFDDVQLAVTDRQSDELLQLNDLTQNEADLIRKFYIYRFSLKELSQEYGISLSACKMRLKRAREKLMKAYEIKT
ncbi:hypothetical protein SDC9_60846 [bioreactor metagenome]|uniref:ECF RNA polymerase sigma factor SigW n=1 Tax=bioreactor metagenome TaxID=1076179 RepID=A0A644XJT7_9ZZZZ